MHQRVVTFRSRRFEAAQPGSHFINPDCFGEDLVAWLRPALAGADVRPSEPIQEDYGWGIWARPGGDPYWIAAGRIGGDADADSADRPRPDAEAALPAEWAIFITYDPGLDLWRRLVRRPRVGGLHRICGAIDAALRFAPDIESITWWDIQPFRGDGRPTP